MPAGATSMHAYMKLNALNFFSKRRHTERLDRERKFGSVKIQNGMVRSRSSHYLYVQPVLSKDTRSVMICRHATLKERIRFTFRRQNHMTDRRHSDLVFMCRENRSTLTA